MNQSELPEPIIELADQLYEMYSLEELEDIPFMLKELKYLRSHMTKIDILVAIDLSLSWKRLETSKRYKLD